MWEVALGWLKTSPKTLVSLARLLVWECPVEQALTRNASDACLQLHMLCKGLRQWFPRSTRLLIHTQVGDWCRLSHSTEPSRWGPWAEDRPGFCSKVSYWEPCPSQNMAPLQSCGWMHLSHDPLCVYLSCN